MEDPFFTRFHLTLFHPICLSAIGFKSKLSYMRGNSLIQSESVSLKPFLNLNFFLTMKSLYFVFYTSHLYKYVSQIYCAD